MPLLFLLSCWGVITAFRPRAVGRTALVRIPMFAAAVAGTALFVWGYIAPRYLADFVPFLVLAQRSGHGRHLASPGRAGGDRLRLMSVLVIGVVGLFTIVANVAMAITPNEEWDIPETVHYVAAQKALSDITGHPIDNRVRRGAHAASVGTGGPAVRRGPVRWPLHLQRGELRHRAQTAVPA